MTAIPSFPHFRPLTLADRPAIEAITMRFPPYSDFIFSGLWAWDTDQRGAIAMLGENLVFRLKDYTSEDHFYAFLGQDDVVEASATLLAHARQEGLLPRLKHIPAEVIAADARLQRSFSVAPNRDDFDYIYAVSDWARFPHPAFAKHREKIEACERKSPLVFQMLEVGDPACQSAMQDLFQHWAHQKRTCSVEESRHEYTALLRLFALAGDAHIAACGGFADERLVAFAIWEAMPGGEYVVGHFQKTDRSYRGLSSWLAHRLGQHLLHAGYRLINGEQDLGLAGLRAHKVSLAPCTALRKYTIAERGA